MLGPPAAAGSENELIHDFHSVFEPVIRKQRGFQDVKLLKLNEVKKGPTPNRPHRIVISFASEAERVAWVASDDHQRVWPEVEKHLSGEKYLVVLYDVL